jgi:hypothetical protein
MDFQQLTYFIFAAIQSSASSSIFTGAFGAFFGAWGAQAVISRGQRRQLVIAELNSINAALSVCFSICNTYANLKKQQALPILQAVEQARLNRDSIVEKNKALSPPFRLPVEVNFDFQTIVAPKVPTELLERTIYEKIAIQGRGLGAFNSMVNAVNNLNSAISYREQLMHDFKERNPPANEKLRLYLGDKTADGGADSRYPDCVKAINSGVDDCIFLSKTISDDLARYGETLRGKHTGWLMGPLPKIAKIDWSRLSESGLLPPEANYEGWLKGFRPTVS